MIEEGGKLAYRVITFAVRTRVVDLQMVLRCALSATGESFGTHVAGALREDETTGQRAAQGRYPAR
jgi:hypothetical protein